MHEGLIADCDVVRFDAAANIFTDAGKFIAVEERFDLMLNGELFQKIFCSPSDLEDLASGILAQADKISSVDDVTRLEVNGSLIDVTTKANVQPLQKNFSDVTFTAKDIIACADKLLSELSTRNGLHSGALFDGKDILICREDIGRHNVFDKLFGAALRERIDLSDKLIIFSGRCSSEMMTKLVRMNVPAVVARSIPTTHAINLAKKFGITLVGSISADSFCIYTNPERIVLS